MHLLEAVETVVKIGTYAPLLTHSSITINTPFHSCDFISEVKRQKRKEGVAYRNALKAYYRYSQAKSR